MSAAGTRYLSIRLLGAVVVAAVIVNHHVSVLVVEAGGRDQLPAAAVVREVVPGGTHTPGRSDTGSGQSRDVAQEAPDSALTAAHLKGRRQRFVGGFWQTLIHDAVASLHLSASANNLCQQHSLRCKSNIRLPGDVLLGQNTSNDFPAFCLSVARCRERCPPPPVRTSAGSVPCSKPPTKSLWLQTQKYNRFPENNTNTTLLEHLWLQDRERISCCLKRSVCSVNASTLQTLLPFFFAFIYPFTLHCITTQSFH